MGADLYVKDLPRKKQYRGFEVSQDAVNAGYFRDCYNSSGLFVWLSKNTDMEFSWWQILDKHDDWFRQDTDDGCMMSVAGAKKFLKMLKLAEKQFVVRKKFYKVAESKMVSTLDEMKFEDRLEEQTKKETLEYFKWFGLLLQLVETAIKRKSEIIWSV